jgi:hypothetical protein
MPHRSAPRPRPEVALLAEIPVFVATVLEWCFWSYLASGALFGAAFVARGASALDPAAAAAPLAVRVVWFPGAVALWPWLARRWWLVRGSAA